MLEFLPARQKARRIRRKQGFVADDVLFWPRNPRLANVVIESLPEAGNAAFTNVAAKSQYESFQMVSVFVYEAGAS